MNRVKQQAEFAVYIALAFIFGYIESLIPLPLPFPGMKLGLANLVIMIILYRKNFAYAFGAAMLRNILNAITFGSLFSFFYSLAGSIASLLIMALIRKWGNDRLSILSVSALGGIFHNMGQLIVAAVLIGPNSLLWYVPILYFSGLLTGAAIGMISGQCLARLPKNIGSDIENL